MKVENFINKLENENEFTFTLEVTPQAKADLGYLAQKIELEYDFHRVLILYFYKH